MGALLGRKHSADCKHCVAVRAVKHGHKKQGRPSRTYVSWIHMKDRCTNPKNIRWYLYGGNGVTVCERWLVTFENFLADMGERPMATSLDRIDRTKGYEPGNCRWADASTQNKNRRNWR